jgi:hypothetical protein
MRTGFIWLKVGAMAGYCEHGSEPWGSIKGWIFINLHSNYCFLKDSIPWS